MMQAYDKKLYPFNSKWKNIDGNHVHYIDEGKGEIILFCHPPVASSFMYRNMIRVLSNNYRCIALDFPGFGLSQETHNYTQSIQSQSVIVGKFIEELQLTGILLLMQEVGGHAAFSAIMKSPEIMKGIIISDTIVFPCSDYSKIYKMLSLVNGGFFNYINTNFNFLIRAMTKFGIRKRKLSKEERFTYKAMFSTKERRRNITHMLHELVVQEELLIQIQNELETTLNNIPALIIYGGKDPLTEMGVPQRTNKLLPNSELHWIEGEGHFPHEGQPERMSEIIHHWIEKISDANKRQTQSNLNHEFENHKS